MTNERASHLEQAERAYASAMEAYDCAKAAAEAAEDARADARRSAVTGLAPEAARHLLRDAWAKATKPPRSWPRNTQEQDKT